MTINFDFLMFVIGLITLLGASFGFSTKLLLGIRQDGAQTKEMVAGLKSDLKNTKEFHTCEFNRLDKAVADLTEEVNKHEARIIKLENTKK